MSQQMLTAHFSRKEMECPHCGVCLMRQEFMNRLEDLRMHWMQPINVISGYRCPDHNRSIGGKKASQHLKGNASDLELPSDEKKALEFIELCKVHFNAVERITKSSVHVDLGPRRHWSY